MPVDTFSLRDLAAAFDAAGLGRWRIGRGARARGLVLARAPWSARRARKAEKKNKLISRGIPSRVAEPSRASETRSACQSLCRYVEKKNKPQRIPFVFPNEHSFEPIAMTRYMEHEYTPPPHTRTRASCRVDKGWLGPRRPPSIPSLFPFSCLLHLVYSKYAPSVFKVLGTASK